MHTLTLPERQAPVIATTEVLVVGSGPGGLSAAISAARAGAEVLLVDRYGCFGGNLTQVGVEGIAWYRQDGTVDVEGIGIEFETGAGVAAAVSLQTGATTGEVSLDAVRVELDRQGVRYR